MTSHWPDTVDEVLGGDLAVVLAHVTPASGVVVSPVTNFGVRDSQAGTIVVNSSVGAWRKLEGMRRNPHVAVAFHTREHGSSSRPEYVLVQGRASFPWPPDRDAWLDSMSEPWARIGGDRPQDVGRLWRRWMSVYFWRVNVEIAVERVVVWPDASCRGAPVVHGTPLPASPPEPQLPPARGTGPRIDHARAAKRAARLPNRLLGWVGTDGFPVVAPVEVAGSEEQGIVLEPPEGLVPAGGRRAGLTAHWFTPRVLGQEQRVHTGWMEASPNARQVVYAPHTKFGYRLPPSDLLYRASVGFVTRVGLRRARRAGVLTDG